MEARENQDLLQFQPTPSLRRATTLTQDITKPYQFQPTPSLRRATLLINQIRYPVSHFNPRPPCGGRHDEEVVLP